MPKKVDLTNKTFGELTVISENEIRAADGKVKWNCLCSCGNKITTSGANLRTGDTKSCGCLYNPGTTTHGYSKTPEYNIWKGMKQRCYNPKALHYADYGVRGITICDKWINDFVSFLSDIGPMPIKGFSIERVDNNRGYEPDNCIWASKKDQGKNKRNNRYIEYNGIRLHLQGWADHFRIPVSTLHSSLKINSFDKIYLKYARNS